MHLPWNDGAFEMNKKISDLFAGESFIRGLRNGIDHVSPAINGFPSFDANAKILSIEMADTAWGAQDAWPAHS